MPLTPRAAAHIRHNLTAIFRGRTSPTTLHFLDGTTKTLDAIWKTPELDDPETPTLSRDVDAILQISLADVTIRELQATTHVTPSSWEGAQTTGFVSRYIITDIQPKGTAWPPNRAHAYLQKAE